MFSDLTLQRNLEKIRRDFVANVSHELRSPLTILSGFIETILIDQNIDKTSLNKFLNIMDEEAKRMNNLIDDILSLSKVESEEHILPSTIVSTGYFSCKDKKGFFSVSLCDIDTLLFSLSISVIKHEISSPTLNIFFAEGFFFVQLSSLECSRVVKPGSNSQKAPKSIILTTLTL